MSLEAKQIHPAVQKALYRKIDGLNRLKIGNQEYAQETAAALDVKQQFNPIEQQMARMCWARVTAAVIDPDKTGLDGLNDQPIYFSSFIEQSNNSDIKNANRPLTYNKNSSNLGESKENIYRGETGITSVQVDQLSFFVKKMTISFSCPDPIDFEERIQPIFLRHGQYCAVEFGWGTNDSDITMPDLSFADIQKLNSSVKERNLASAGNYQCDVGIVSNYTFELNTDGGYTGTIDIITRGQNVLNQTSQNSADIARDTLSVQTSVSNLKSIADYDNLTDDEKKLLSDSELELIEAAKDDLQELQRAKITYKKTMMNLEGVLDKYLNDANKTGKVGQKILKDYADDFGNINIIEKLGSVDYRFKNGVLKTSASGLSIGTVTIGDQEIDIDTGFAPLNRNVSDNYYISWGWFEDHILNSFFSATVNITKGDKNKQQDLQSIRSVFNDKESNTIKPNKCHIAKHLWSKGLDTVILPSRTHPSYKDKVKKELGARLTGEFHNQLKQTVVRAVFEMIDENFKPFIPTEILFTQTPGSELTRTVRGEPRDYGIIRNMVFPIGKFRLHFENMETLKQGLRSFWADVQNEYGGFWQFGIGQEQENTGRIGVFELLYNTEAEAVDLFMSENQSTRQQYINWDKGKPDPEKIFTFPVYSKDSFVKDFGLTVKMSAKAATIAVYGSNTNVATGTQRSSDIQDISIQAYSLLLNPTKKAKTAEELTNELKSKLAEGMVTQMQFPIDDDMIGTGTAPSTYQQMSQSVQPINQDGLDFASIPESNPDTNEVIERLLGSSADEVPDADAFYYWYNDRESMGARFYNNDGNMKSEYVKTMLHLINNSLCEGDESNIQTRKVVIPIDISMTIDGVGGLRPFDLFRVDYLPEIYRNFTYFQIFNVGHTVTPAGWETNITAKMKLDLPKFKSKYGYTKPKRDIKRIAAEFRTREEFQEVQVEIKKIESYIQSARASIVKLKAFSEIGGKFIEADLESFKLQSSPETDEIENRNIRELEINPNTQLLIRVLPGATGYRISEYKKTVYRPSGEIDYGSGQLTAEEELQVSGLVGGTLNSGSNLTVVTPRKLVSFFPPQRCAERIQEIEKRIEDYKNEIIEIRNQGRFYGPTLEEAIIDDTYTEEGGGAG